MKLSETIRLGAMLGPQLRNGSTLEGSSSCALGAALLAMGTYLMGDLYRQYPILKDAVTGPIQNGGRHPLDYWIVLLNDHFQWTREQIADWVQTIEDQPKGTHEQTSQPLPEPDAVEVA